MRDLDSVPDDILPWPQGCQEESPSWGYEGEGITCERAEHPGDPWHYVTYEYRWSGEPYQARKMWWGGPA